MTFIFRNRTIFWDIFENGIEDKQTGTEGECEFMYRKLCVCKRILEKVLVFCVPVNSIDKEIYVHLCWCLNMLIKRNHHKWIQQI